MADNSSMDWQRQNFKKSGSEPAQTKLNPKLTPSGTVASMHSKIATPTHGMGGLVSSGMPEPLKMANGGLIAGLAAGLGAAYLYNKNKDKEVGVDKYGFKQTGESEMRSAESDTDKARVISAGVKSSSDSDSNYSKGSVTAKDIGFTGGSEESSTKSEPNSGSSYTGGVGSADNDPVAPKAAPKKTAARAVVKPVRAAEPEPKASQDSAFRSSDEDIEKRSRAATEDDPEYGKSKTLKRIVNAVADTAKGKSSYDPFASPLNKR